ncbi:MAG: hypothetical protein ABIQ32_05375 [Sphingomicrobium sp.]
MKRILAATALLLCSCGDERPPLPTEEQSDQLNEAEDMLNQTSQANESSGVPDAR